MQPDQETRERGSRKLQRLGMALLLFIGGLFVSVGTYGFFAFLGIPMMLLGLAYPFLDLDLEPRSKTWRAFRSRRTARR